ncbi:hypothetical protein ACX8Z9_15725 [Arthrobacter halodurans]|uniref:MYXO-CTERM domain-containing protein n=1 Tax=Arthrobacter halodurans TaxID=516699 RepID=A0ABV4UQN3_9MICC
MSHKPRNATPWAVWGWSAVVVGGAAGVVLFLQPWRSCVEDDAPAGCPATALDTNLLWLAMLLCVAGLALVFFAALRRRVVPSRRA